MQDTFMAEKKSASAKKYYQQNKEKILAKAKLYYQQNKEKISERAKEYYQQNKDKSAKRYKVYYDKNKEDIKERKNMRHRARIIETMKDKSNNAKYSVMCPVSQFIEYVRTENTAEFLEHYDARVRGTSECIKYCKFSKRNGQNCPLCEKDLSDEQMRAACPVSSAFRFDNACDRIRVFVKKIQTEKLDKVGEAILTVIRNLTGVQQITKHTQFQNGLGMDSLDMMDLLIHVEEEFNIENAGFVLRASDCKTVGDLIILIKQHYQINDAMAVMKNTQKTR